MRNLSLEFDGLGMDQTGGLIRLDDCFKVGTNS
jgi:hypothetical protein